MVRADKTLGSVIADFDAFYPKFAGIAEKTATQIESQPWQDWFKDRLPDVDPKLLTALQTFTMAYEGKRKLQTTNPYARNDIYDKAPDHVVNLSEIFSSNHAMCVETAILAKKFLDDKGITSRLFSGEAMFNYEAGDINFPIPHTFLIIEHQGKEYVYDPTNPTINKEGAALFTLMEPKASFASRLEDLQNGSLMICAENLLTERCTYYGVGDGCNVQESAIIHGSKSKPLKEPPKEKGADDILRV